MSKIHSSIALTFLLCVIWSCDQYVIDEFDRSSQGEFAIPLGHGTFKVEDFFQMSSEMDQLISDENGHLSVVYQSERVSVDPSVLLPTLPLGLPIPLEDTAVAIDLPSFNGLIIEQAVLSGDQLTFSFVSPHTESLKVKVSSSSFLVNDAPFSATFLMPVSEDVPNVLITEPISLDGFVLNSPNQKIELKYQAENDDGEYRPLTSAFLTINAIDFRSFQGNVDRTGIELPSGFVEIDFFDNWNEGDFFINKPFIKVDIENSFSIPIGVILEEVIVTTKSNQQLDLTSDVVKQVINLSYPDQNEKGDTMFTSFSLDASNSNIEEIFASLPKRISYSFSGIINPDGLDETFCLNEDNTLNGSASVTLPLDGYANEATITDTFLVSLAEVPDIRDAELSWVADNGMPVSISVQFELLDGADQSLGFFFPGIEPVIGAAEADSDGNVVLPTRLVSKIALSGTIIEKLNLTSKIVVLASFTTFERNKRVIFSKDQSLDVFLGLKFKQGT